MHIENELRLDFKDVLIRPKRSTLTSRHDVTLTREFRFRWTKQKSACVPVIAANMDTTGTFEMAKVLTENGMMTALHKHYAADDLIRFFSDETNAGSVFYSLGIGKEDFSKFQSVYAALQGEIRFVCIDVANGYTEAFVDFVKHLRTNYPDLVIMAGNVVTGDMTEELILAGADIVKVGIGPGSVCTTRKIAGVGYPQLSAVIECADAAHGLGGSICADGGCTCPGDIAKAMGGGADFVMVGGLFAGHNESGGELVHKDGQTYRAFYGMSSKDAMDKYSGGVASYRAAEGKSVLLPDRGPVQNACQEILGGLRSACTYVGARRLKELTKRTTFVRVGMTTNNIFGVS